MFPKMPEVLPAGQIGEAKVEHFEVSQIDSKISRVRAASHSGFEGYVPEGKYARLIVGGTMMMSDTPMERRSNANFVRLAHGHVLVGGLGLGMILHALADKPEVTAVTVLESSADVIALVAPTLPKLQNGSEIRCVCADVFFWKPERADEKFDVIYMDIWPTITEDSLPEINTLHRRYRKWLTPESPRYCLLSWQHDMLKRMRRASRREGPGRFWRNPMQPLAGKGI